jgi:hypothetical protein
VRPAGGSRAGLESLRLISPPLGRKVAIVGHISGGSQAEETCRIAFTQGLGLGKAAFDERKGFIRRWGLLAYHPKTGRWTDLSNHLLGDYANPPLVTI